MKKAVSKILILIIIAILIAGGFFVWKKWSKPESNIQDQKFRLPPGIEVIEQGDKKIVRNTVEGYELTVPKEWRVDASKTHFFSPEYMSGKGNCQVSINVINRKISVEALKEELEKEHKEWYTIIEDKYEVLEIAGYKALKNIFYAEGEGGYSIDLYIPVNDKLYSFGGGTLLSDIESCSQYIENILKTISIKK